MLQMDEVGATAVKNPCPTKPTVKHSAMKKLDSNDENEMTPAQKTGVIATSTAAGAAIGSIVPVIGTAIGAGIGAILSGIAVIASEMNNKKDK